MKLSISFLCCCNTCQKPTEQFLRIAPYFIHIDCCISRNLVLDTVAENSYDDSLSWISRREHTNNSLYNIILFPSTVSLFGDTFIQNANSQEALMNILWWWTFYGDKVTRLHGDIYAYLHPITIKCWLVRSSSRKRWHLVLSYDNKNCHGLDI